MIKLNPNSYKLVNSCLRSVNINYLFVLAVLENKVKGEEFVDDIKNPESFYIKHPYGMSLLFGSTENESFNNCLKTYLLNKDKQRLKPEWLQTYPKSWNKKFADLLQDHLTIEESDDKKVIQDARINFKFDISEFESFTNAKESSILIKRITKESYDLIEGQVIPQCFYNDSEHFIKEGVGFSAIFKGIPVATSFAAFFMDGKLEIGIETIAYYRGKGLAQIVCSCLIEYCLQNKLEPVWACRGSNQGSIKLAESLGFKQVLNFPYYKLPCN